QPPVDLVLCGRESGDWQGGQLGAFLAAELDFAYVSFVASISQEAEKNTVRMRRQSDEGWELINCQLPAVATITNDEGN
ncbi:MAG: electron transfer flavoprotein subunit beta/FixA family protein, partial [Anaerolineae bacterium]|nr:electron transfer flavoprotein subunit beta/FixA family protein [Anaerolineae bacterium]